jgi:hypothetical protein
VPVIEEVVGESERPAQLRNAIGLVELGDTVGVTTVTAFRGSPGI